MRMETDGRESQVLINKTCSDSVEKHSEVLQYFVH